MAKQRIHWRVAAGFVCWALLRDLGENSFDVAMRWQHFAATCLTDGSAALALIAWAIFRRCRPPQSRAWFALLFVAAVELAAVALYRPYVDGVFHLHYARAAQQTLILMAAPLWLALLTALGLTPDEVPRRTAGAAIAGIGAIAILLQADDLTVVPAAVPVLVLSVLMAIATVWTWSYAKRSLAELRPEMAAGCGLLLSAALNGLLSLIAERPRWQPVDWRSASSSFAGAVLVAIAAGLLWYWLLQRMELAAFAMQTQAMLFGNLLVPFAMFGFLGWRLDVALALGIGALAVALRASPEDDEPVHLLDL